MGVRSFPVARVEALLRKDRRSKVRETCEMVSDVSKTAVDMISTDNL